MLKIKKKQTAMEIQLEHQEAQPIDEATKAALAEAREQVERGEAVTLEQSTVNLKKRVEAWRKAKKEVALTA
jgi:hypothetical protein